MNDEQKAALVGAGLDKPIELSPMQATRLYLAFQDSVTGGAPVRFAAGRMTMRLPLEIQVVDDEQRAA